MKFRFFMVCIAVLSLSGCFRQDFIVAEVFAKEHEPETYVDKNVKMHGKLTKFRIYDDEDYKLLVTTTEEGAWTTDTWYVTKEDYDKIEVGDKVNFYSLKLLREGVTKHDPDLRVRFDDDGNPLNYGDPIDKEY